MGSHILEVQFKSTGFHGAPGYTNLFFHAEDETAQGYAATAAQTFMDSVRAWFPMGWRCQMQPELRVLDDVTGELVDSYLPGSIAAELSGAGSTNGYGSGASGVCLSWRTGTINWSRKVRGRTFLVPIDKSQYDEDGTVNGHTITTTLTAAQTLIDVQQADFGIWSRPRAGAGGKFASVTGKSMTDQAAVLRSRR